MCVQLPCAFGLVLVLMSCYANLSYSLCSPFLHHDNLVSRLHAEALDREETRRFAESKESKEKRAREELERLNKKRNRRRDFREREKPFRRKPKPKRKRRKDTKKEEL